MKDLCSHLFFTILIMVALDASSFGSIVPPPDLKESCASAEYQALKNQASTNQSSRAQDASTSEPSTLIVVAGSKPLNTTQEISMGKQVTVCIMGLHDWIYKQKNKPEKLRLFIGGYLFQVAPTSVSPANQEYLNFILKIDLANSDDWKAWAAIVDAARHSQNNQLPISVGIVDSRSVFESNAAVKIPTYPKEWLCLLGAFTFLLTALIYFAAKSDLLRYVIGEKPQKPSRSPYSLGLVQMAWWFYLVVVAYVYIWVSTDQIHVPMGSVLGLLGISTTTGLAAIFVDKQKEASAKSQRSELLAEQDALKARIGELESLASLSTAAEAELAAKKSRLTEVEAAIKQLPPAPTSSISKNFISDILNDGDGISFHRFQIIVWTIVLGTVFVWAVYRNMSMPDFDPSLLTLMGISSGTYVGFKFPEKLK